MDGIFPPLKRLIHLRNTIGRHRKPDFLNNKSIIWAFSLSADIPGF